MIKKISSACINNNNKSINYILYYHDNGVECQILIFNKSFQKQISSEKEIYEWISNTVYKETGIIFKK